ncbi:spirocyclase AveC family protein [Mycobacterium manitobense]|uniref:Spirocyclase AveC family protein n=1 Tax=[Mycobacterium] manitobense TaxID=190147 RepID=A0A9X2YG87_9MYCO|nr:spirocyclase AveC family protein [[Mycobacterium] manitobense]MCV7174068.1 spirocyclase AveC family protein [[Mycobacterium] manitobense]
MTDQQTHRTPADPDARADTTIKVLWWLFAIGMLVLIGLNGQVGAGEARIANPDVSDEARESVAGLANWAALCNIWTTVMMVVGVAAFAYSWQRHPKHPYLLMVLAGTVLVWLDPFANWVSYSAFSPDLWHYPVDWPWVSLAPLVEPFVCIAYASVLIIPAFVAIPLLQRLQRGRSVDSFVWRHPLITLSAITFAIGFALDAVVEVFCVSKRVYAYTQVPEFGSLFAGQYNQFPLLWESGLATSMMIAASILIYRDDTGRTHAEKLAQRLRMLPTKPALASFIIMISALSLSYIAVYGGGFMILRAGKLATSVACPWPFPETKVYDPQGFYEMAGHPGPFYEGTWNTWMSGQPDGRPVIEGPVPAGPCGPGRE